MEKLRLPSIKGQFGDWVYFIATMKAKDVSNPERISTVGESNLYPKNINEVLQREIDTKRIEGITEYLASQKERFLNALIVAVHKGSPTWSEIRINESFQVEGESLNSDEVLFLGGALGVLTLEGTEKIFALDGQHRLKGIRAALVKNKELSNEDITIIFVVHSNDLKERTRRLFTVLNRYAEKPKKAELIIMDEDDAAAILTRRLILEYDLFKLDNAISKARDFALSASDFKNFTTLVCLYEITKVLVKYDKIYPKRNVIKRPSDEVLVTLYDDSIVPFWDYFFDVFPEVVDFVAGDEGEEDFVRNKKTGGSLLLRPEAQLLIASLYMHFKNKGIKEFEKFKKKLPKIDFNLSNDTWKYVFWTGTKMNSKDKKAKRDLFMFLLGEPTDAKIFKATLDKVYKEYEKTYNGEITPIV